MTRTERVQVHENCLVPYRRTNLGIEFCLVSEVSANRWEFPKSCSDVASPAGSELLNEAAAAAGLRGHMHDESALDAFDAARGNEARRVTAYLMQVTLIEDDWPGQATHRRLWCLAEEARARLRRKPLRRFIDLALRAVASANGSGNGHPPASLPRRPR